MVAETRRPAGNAMKHGLCSHLLLIEENAHRVEMIRQDLIECYKPRLQLEDKIINELAVAQFKVPDKARKLYAKAQQAFDKANEMAHSNVQLFDQAATACKARFADLQMKTMEFTQANVNAGFALARKLIATKDPAEFFAAQQDFAREQSQALQSQFAEFNTLSVALAKETAKPVQDSFSKSFGEFGKTFAA